MKFKDLRAAGVFKLMPNGCNIYDNETDKKFKYVEINGVSAYTVNNTTIYPKQLDDFEVTCIGSDPSGELEVPALWIKMS